MRILLFNTAHRWVGEAAGVELLARALSVRGHEVHMAVPRGGSLWDSLKDQSLPYRLHTLPWRLRVGQGARPAPNLAAQYRPLWKLLREGRPDVLHASRGKEHWRAAWLRPLACPDAVIVRTRHVVLPMGQHGPNRWLFHHGTDAVTAVSAAAFAGLGELGSHLPPERRRIVEAAVDLQRYSPALRNEALRRDLGCGPEDLLVGCLGRYQRIKGQDLFLLAAGRVAQRVPNARFVVAGRKVTLENERLAREYAASGLGDRVRFLGFLDDAPRLLASLDLSVVASRGSEGFSRIAVESFASGVPLVATTVGALPQLVRDGETGLLVPPENMEAMAEAMTTLLLDSARRRAIADAAAGEAAQRFAPDRLAREMEAVYEAALAARR